MNKLNLAFAAAVLTFGAHAAHAQSWPASVVGNWTVRGNLSVGALNITSQASTGRCRGILGTIYGNPIQGFYCPTTGRLYFVRKVAPSNDTVQVWSGNLSDSGPTLLIAGSFASVDNTAGRPNGGPFGEYSFSATK